MATATVYGYPRIGANRELKRATEAYWAGRTGADALRRTAAGLRRGVWSELCDAGIDEVPAGFFSLYDQVLDMIALLGAVPARYGHTPGEPIGLDTYFAMARGSDRATAMEMTKWFDTNYHAIVPELGPDTRFALTEVDGGCKPLDELAEAAALGIAARPALIGPVTFLLLAKPADTDETPAGFDPLSLLDDLLDVYAELLGRLAAAGAAWVQLDEPAFAADRSETELAALARAYDTLGRLTDRPKLLVPTYFDHAGDALGVLAATPVEGVGLDLTRGGARNLDLLTAIGGLPGKRLVAGVVDGRNVWATDLKAALATLGKLRKLAGELVVAPSCSLQHVPLDVSVEARLDPELRRWLAFARQKVDEVVTLARGLDDGPGAIAAELGANAAALAHRRASPLVSDPAVRARAAATTEAATRRPQTAPERAGLQRKRLDLPLLPTTTIGSFPQTAELRSARASLRAGDLDQPGYDATIRAEIERVVRLQERIGLDVLVHGEPERNDMVQFFAEQLRGYAFTADGWVQSYGSRYVRPPILYGDVARPGPMSVAEATFAQSLTERPMKGMLTGPVTMLKWSFVRDDQPEAATATQVALALRDEVADLEAAGIGVVQVDEPALREGLPLRRERRDDYLAWAVRSFRLATAGVRDETSIHTHMCYSEFGDILDVIAALDADVTSVEAARSRMELAADLERAGFAAGIGPGIYDIHSPRVPSVDDMERLLRQALAALDPAQLWVNPDCGLKTRAYDEVEPSLRNLVEAARRVRADLPAGP
jgi:5-methyltetrahydropteroyltriglutamate--homocysteine methyltransferase